MEKLRNLLILAAVVFSAFPLVGCSPAAEESEETPQVSGGGDRSGQGSSDESSGIAPQNPTAAPTKE